MCADVGLPDLHLLLLGWVVSAKRLLGLLEQRPPLLLGVSLLLLLLSGLSCDKACYAGLKRHSTQQRLLATATAVSQFSCLCLLLLGYRQRLQGARAMLLLLLLLA